MKITIRPAPHSKSCAVAGKGWCSRFDDQPLRCETECPEGYCCEMKHCWQVGEKLRDILIARGHEVKMADKKYRKESTTAKANDGMKKAMKELLAWKPDVHLAIHTNSYDDKVVGIRFGYPSLANNPGESARVNSSLRLANELVKTNKEIYHTPSAVKTCNYNFYEINYPTCPAVYIEGCFANSAKKDGDWWHENMDAIAKSYADALEAWWLGEGHSLPDGRQPAPIVAATTAIINTSGAAGLSMWDSYKKHDALAKVKKNEVVNVLSLTPDNNFYYCEYQGTKGYIDGQYLLFENDENKDYATINTKSSYGLSLWDTYKKGKSLIKVKKGEVVDILSSTPDHNFYYCEYNGVKGYVDGQYLVFVDKEEVKKEETETNPSNSHQYAVINTKFATGLSLWDGYQKDKTLVKVKKGEMVKILSMTADHGFYRCEYNGVQGYVDGQYLKFEEAEYATINTKYDTGLSLWDSYKKDKAMIQVKKGEKVTVLSMTANHGFYYCEYNGVKGYVDGQYLKF